MTSNFYSGTSGLVLPVRQSLYPEEFRGKSRLTYYAVLFNSVEINCSFYKMPQIATVSKWAESVDDHFQFTFKLSKSITHAKALDFKEEDIALFLQTIEHIGNKRGCLLIQFPPSLKIKNIGQVEQLLMAIKNGDKNDLWKVAIEFRNLSWYHEEVYHLLKNYNATMVIHDLPASPTPLFTFESSFMYLRFHGPGGRYRGSYSDEFLHQYATHVKAWLNEGKPVYIYFNNTMGDAIKNLQTLNSFVGGNFIGHPKSLNI